MRRWLPMPGKRRRDPTRTQRAGRMMDFLELAVEAFGDLLKKHGRSTDLKTTLRESVKREELERH